MILKRPEYLEFEKKYIGELTNLWYDVQYEPLRSVILKARVVLEDIFDGADQVSTARDNGDGNSTQQVVKTKKL